MRTIIDLSDAWQKEVFAGGEENLPLPMRLPAESLPETLTLSHMFTVPDEDGTDRIFLRLRRLTADAEIFVDGERAASARWVS